MKLLTILFFTFFVAAGSSAFDEPGLDLAPDPGPEFSAEIRRTDYGIPHIKADSWASLGYGYGYAYAQDNFCVGMKEIAIGASKWAESTGDDPANDQLWRFINGTRDEFRTNFYDKVSQTAKDLATGYAAGMNRYRKDIGDENLPEGENGCRGESWVYDFDEIDLMMYMRKIAFQASIGQELVQAAALAVTGPNTPAEQARVQSGSLDDINVDDVRKAFKSFIKVGESGSNAIIVGSEDSQTGTGLLLGNPHQPWNGSGRWYEAHLTIPGVYDVAGASLQGLPWIAIGFTKDIAWTHTVDYATRFTLQDVDLNPEDPMQYDYDGEWRDIIPTTVTVGQKQFAGTPEEEVVEVSRTFYSTHYGLVLDLGGIDAFLGGWPTFANTLVTMRDANLDTGLRSTEQWIEKSQATNVKEYRDALRQMGNPVFHEFAVDKDGDIYYGQASVVPHVTQAQLDDCPYGVTGFVGQLTKNAIFGLHGSRSDCEWGTDETAPAGTNIYGLDAHPEITGKGTVGNSNNSYWLNDATNPLTGFPIVFGWMGAEGEQQFTRTRNIHTMIAARLAGEDDLSETPGFDLETLKGLLYSNGVYAAEIVLDDVLAICAKADELKNMCSVLAAWDRKANLDSVGLPIFVEFWAAIREKYPNPFRNIVSDPAFWKNKFMETDPINTPSGINDNDDDVVEAVINALKTAKTNLDAAGVLFDTPWGKVQYLERNGKLVPIHGGPGTTGVLGAITSTLQPESELGLPPGYRNPTHGNSYIQAVTWDGSGCPIADTILTHSQSVQPTSDHYGDQTDLYSRKEWIRFSFCEDDIVATQIGETLVIEQ